MSARCAIVFALVTAALSCNGATLDDAARDAVEVSVLIQQDDGYIDLYGGGLNSFIGNGGALAQEMLQLLQYLQTTNMFPQITGVIPYLISGGGYEQIHMQKFLETLGLNPYGSYVALDLINALKQLISQQLIGGGVGGVIMSNGVVSGGVMTNPGGTMISNGLIGKGFISNGLAGNGLVGNGMFGNGMVGGGTQSQMVQQQTVQGVQTGMPSMMTYPVGTGSLLSQGMQNGIITGQQSLGPIGVMPTGASGVDTIEISVQNVGKPHLAYPVGANKFDYSSLLQELTTLQELRSNYGLCEGNLLQLQNQIENLLATIQMLEQQIAFQSMNTGCLDAGKDVDSHWPVPIATPCQMPVQIDGSFCMGSQCCGWPSGVQGMGCTPSSSGCAAGMCGGCGKCIGNGGMGGCGGGCSLPPWFL